MIKTILTALTESLILESYKDVKARFINAGADKDEVTKLLDLHKKLKDMNRLKKDEVNIDLFTKGISFDEFKSLMSRYSEKDTATKTDKWNELKNKIVAENDEWTVYAIDTPEEAYLFHGLVKWCISSGTKEDAKRYFNNYSIGNASIFFAIVRKNPIGDEYDYIMDQYQWSWHNNPIVGEENAHTYWDAKDNSHTRLKRNLNVPSYKNAIDKGVTNAEAKLKQKVLDSLKLNNDGTYSCDKPLSKSVLKYFIENGRFTIKFKEVSSNFSCDYCELTSLEGCPEKVGGYFDCMCNNLTSLEGGPKEVGRYYDCSRNKLTSLEGCPEKVAEYFSCTYNELTTLKGGPKEVGGDFKCSDNKLTSLEGAPEKVGGDFDCRGNKLKSLKGAPKEVGESFWCSGNKDLKSLDGLGEVKGEIYSDIKKIKKKK